MENELGNEIRIEPISEEYIENFHRCLDSVARERKHLAFLEAPPLDSTRDFVISNITKNVPQFIAIKGNDVIGWCDILPEQMEGFRHNGTLGMGVLKEYRQLGIGKKLAERTINKAKQQNILRIELDVLASNLPAIGLYEKLGFQVECIKKNARIIDGVFDDLIQMVLFIN